MTTMNRRQLLKAGVAIAGGLVMNQISPSLTSLAAQPATLPTAQKLPRWRGFNLFEMFMPQHTSGVFVESDLDFTKEWGFDFLRLPCSYWFWAKPESLYEIDEKPLKSIDQAIAWGRARGIHMNVCMHRIPGYCINPPKEPTDLFKDEKTLDAAAYHWAMFAERYKGIPSTELSFDLMNEPPGVDDATYLRVHGRLTRAIHDVDPDRLVIGDGKGGGHTPVSGVASLGIAMSTRGYQPFELTHYKASWFPGSDTWPVPTWPMTVTKKDGQKIVWDREALKRERIIAWQAVERTGVGIHIGEWGVHNFTPHDVTLAWMKENLDLWQRAGWGWALWNIRGSFGVMDSNREDVTYENVKGRKLDRKMLELLRQY